MKIIYVIWALFALVVTQTAIADECPLAGFWVGTAHSINLANDSVGKSVHGCMVYPDCSYGCDVFGVDRETGDCMRKGLPYYGRMVPFGPLWRTAPTHGDDGTLNVVVVDGDRADINLVSAPGDTAQFIERTTLLRVGDQPPENLIEAQQRLWMLACD